MTNGGIHSSFVIRHSSFPLLLLFGVHRVLAEAGAEFLELELFAARLATQSVVVIAGFLANEEYGFDFLFSFACGHGRVEGSEFRVEGSASAESEALQLFDLDIVRGNRKWLQ